MASICHLFISLQFLSKHPHYQPAMASLLLLSLSLLSLLSSSLTLPPPSSSPGPFTAKAAALRYWHRKNPHHRPLPPFLLSKLSPLSPLSSAALSSAISSATTPFPSSLCSAAHLLCSSSHSHSPPSPSDFSNYNHANFSSYGDSLSGGRDAFKIYSSDSNSAADSFRRYSLRSICPDSYSDTNIIGASFYFILPPLPFHRWPPPTSPPRPSPPPPPPSPPDTLPLYHLLLHWSPPTSRPCLSPPTLPPLPFYRCHHRPLLFHPSPPPSPLPPLAN